MTRPVNSSVLLPILLGACLSETAPTGTRPVPYPISAQRVVVVSIDGLRGDLMARMSTLASLRARGVWTDSMRTVLPALTLPAHLTMFSGRDVTRYGITTNDFDGASAAILEFNGVTTMFQWVRAAGGSTHAVVGSSLVLESQRELAQAFLGVDSLLASGADANVIVGNVISVLRGARPPRLLFVHLADADREGHSTGWIASTSSTGAQRDSIAPAYLAAVAHVDSALARLWSELRPAVDSGSVALIITADHGGGHGEACTPNIPASHEHCTAHPADALVPFVMVARDTPSRRVVGQAVVAQVAPTAAAVLAVPASARSETPVRF